MAEWSRALHGLHGSILAQAASLLFLFKFFFKVFFSLNIFFKIFSPSVTHFSFFKIFLKNGFTMNDVLYPSRRRVDKMRDSSI